MKQQATSSRMESWFLEIVQWKRLRSTSRIQDTPKLALNHESQSARLDISRCWSTVHHHQGARLKLQQFGCLVCLIGVQVVGWVSRLEARLTSIKPERLTKKIRQVFKQLRNGRKCPRSVLTWLRNKKSSDISIDIIVHQSISIIRNNLLIVISDTVREHFSTRKTSRQTSYKWVHDS